MQIISSCLAPGLAVVLIFSGLYFNPWWQPVAASESPPLVQATVVQPLTRVLIVGAVQQPGLYQLPKGSPIADLIQQAGGLTHEAETNPAWLTQAIPENGQVVIPAQKWVAAVSPAPQISQSGTTRKHPSRKARSSKSGNRHQPKFTGKINLLTATLAQWQQIPGIGPGLAKKILAQRTRTPFKQARDLLQVPGIGPKRLQKLLPYLQ